MKKQILITCLMLTACASKPKQDDYLQHVAPSQSVLQESQPVQVLLNAATPLDVRGEYSADDSVNAGNVMYSGAAGIVGMMAQVATHAAISSNMQDSKLSEQQVAANRVLLPLEGVIKATTQQHLQQPSSSVAYTDDATATQLLVSRPIFYMSQDASTVSLRHMVTLQQQNKKGKGKPTVLYQNVIEVYAPSVSNEKSKAAIEHWKDNKGALFLQTTQSLYAKSMAIVLDDIRGKITSTGQQKTISFAYGKITRTERATLLSNDCHYTTVRNLRGWLMSIPTTSVNSGVEHSVCATSKDALKRTQ